MERQALCDVIVLEPQSTVIAVDHPKPRLKWTTLNRKSPLVAILCQQP